jgi:hypothetical protein
MFVRRAAAGLVAIVAILAVHRLVWLPQHCNVVKKQVALSLSPQWHQRDTPAAFSAGELAEPLLVRALEQCPHDLNLLMLAGGAQEMMQRYAQALRFYDQALRFHRRPELYVAAGVAHLRLGEEEKALQSFVTAANFAGPNVLTELENQQLRLKAYRIIGDRRERVLALRGKLNLRNLLVNPDFSRPGDAGATRSDRHGTSPSAAFAWQTLVERGEVSTSMMPSQRRPGGNALRVVTSREGSGIRQALPTENRQPRARTTAMVLVNRGQVCVGSGRGIPVQNACSSDTGRWERLEGISESCPARVTAVTAATKNGADFIVDEISVRVALGAPCER